MFTKTKVSCYKVLKKNKSIMLQYVLVYGIQRRYSKRCRARGLNHCCRRAVTDFDIVQTLVQSQIDLGTLKGNFALKTYLVCQRNCKLAVICYFEKKHVIFARNLQGQNSSKSVASAAQLNALQRLRTTSSTWLMPSVDQISGY